MTVSGEGQWLRPPSSSSLSVSDGSTTVDPTTSIVFSGAIVTDGGGGEADVAVGSSAFSAVLMYGIAQGGDVSFGNVVTFGDTGAWAAVVSVYDTDAYWDGTNKRFNIATTGYYQAQFGTEMSFASGHIGTGVDGFHTYFSFSAAHFGIQPDLYPNMVGANVVRGSHIVEDHFTAGEWIKVNFGNLGSADANWDFVSVALRRIG